LEFFCLLNLAATNQNLRIHFNNFLFKHFPLFFYLEEFFLYLRELVITFDQLFTVNLAQARVIRLPLVNTGKIILKPFDFHLVFAEQRVLINVFVYMRVIPDLFGSSRKFQR
jgi:hypothetical protein